MKITIDIDKLLAEGQINQHEYNRFKSFAIKDTSYLAFNILISFGIIAVIAGTIALFPSYLTSIILGLILFGCGIYVTNKYFQKWRILGTILLLIGTLTASIGIVAITDGSILGFLLMIIICTLGAIFAKQSLLVIVATLALSETFGAMMTPDIPPLHFFFVNHPFITVIIFSALAGVSILIIPKLSVDYSPLAIVFSRTSLFLVNIGFWFGTLQGDVVPDWFFAWAWTITLIGSFIWATRCNRRWLVNTLSVFGTIHFFTQYFINLGAYPATLFIAGIIALGIAVVIARYNKITDRSTTNN